MGLYKRGETWWMRFMHAGRQVRKSTDTADRRMAERIYHSVLGKIAEGKWFERLPGEDKTVRELLERYLAEHSARNKAMTTARRDEGMAVHLRAFFGHERLTTITPRRIAEYKSKRRADGVAPKTINNELVLLSHAFTLAVREWEWLQANPVSRVSKEKVRNHQERWLTHDEEQRLLSVALPWLAELIIFAVETGLRQQEMLRLQWSHVDLFRKTVTILEQKNGGRDTLPISERALEVLKARKRQAVASSFVFVNAFGRPIRANNLLRAFYRARQKADLTDCRWHDLRHTFATRLVQNGVDLYVVQKLGRWKTLTMVQRYAHHYPESLRTGVEVLNRLASTKLAQSGGTATEAIS